MKISYDNLLAKRFVLLGGLLIAAFLLYLPSEVVSAIAIPPDSSEYAISLVNLFEHGIFGFTLNGNWYPSRYSPWFSITCLTPAYILGGGNVLLFHWAILGFAIAFLVLLYKWGQRLGLGNWSILPPILTMFIPDFAFYSRVVMTEIPYVTLFAASALAFLRFADENRPITWKRSLLCGTLVTWGGMVRPSMLPMLLPFAIVVIYRYRRQWSCCLKSLLCLAMPAIAYELMNFTYNWIVFSNPFRSGYQYWMPIPCDYPNLLFNSSYIWTNICSLVQVPLVQVTLVLLVTIVIGTFMAIVIGKRKDSTIHDSLLLPHLLLVAYFLFHGITLLALYLPYYWPDSRFFFAILFCILPLCISSLKLTIMDLRLRPLTFLLLATLCVMFYVTSTPKYFDLPISRQYWFVTGQISLQKIPNGAILIQGGDDNVFDHFGFREKKLTMLPYAREFDYVRHMTAPTSIRDLEPKPSDCWQRNIPELIERGICKLPFPATFRERPSLVVDWLRKGHRVFINQDVVDGEEGWQKLQEQLKKLGLTTILTGGWSAPAVNPNPIRNYYDRLVLANCTMDQRPEFPCILHEIIFQKNNAGKQP